jgi:hypothetical protein
MPSLKVPSPAHLSLLYRETPEKVMKAQLALLNGAPNFSYQPLYKTMRGLLGAACSEKELLSAISKCALRADVREKYAELVPLIADYFCEKKIAYAIEVAPRFYPVARDLLVPFSPPLIYADDKGLCLPYFIFWKKHALRGERLSLFSSIVREILDEDPDLSHARFEVVDMSAGSDLGDKSGVRSLKVFSEEGIGKISKDRKRDMLSTFAEGFRRARQVAAGMPSKRKKREQMEKFDPNQIGLL